MRPLQLSPHASLGRSARQQLQLAHEMFQGKCPLEQLPPHALLGRSARQKLQLAHQMFRGKCPLEQVHLGGGIEIPEAKLSYFTKVKDDLKVTRNLARHLWTANEMKLRCLTGQPCRRISESVAKLQATPEKVGAIRNVVKKLISQTPCDRPAEKRVASARKALRDLFADMARIRHKSLKDVAAAKEKD
ncbi:hypothetical protein HPB48_021857 [Haemaphysalis longicornis]|uniref:BEN domain-containing protein n=1 Tax=Haemaphysalis longicornis TaxID=44386 RepID=A0A9J6GU17_HAELO|nr:hypothetical protein HPB48_021857 [Haemaphysalis longicornis]